MKEKMKTSDIMYSHFRVGSGAATVAGILNKEDGSYRFGVSLCSPEDNFNKRHGRYKAIHKLSKPKMPDGQKRLTSATIRMVDDVRNSEMGRRAVVAVLNSLQNIKKKRWYTGLNEDDVEIRTVWLERTIEARTPLK